MLNQLLGETCWEFTIIQLGNKFFLSQVAGDDFVSLWVWKILSGSIWCFCTSSISKALADVARVAFLDFLDLLDEGRETSWNAFIVISMVKLNAVESMELSLIRPTWR